MQYSKYIVCYFSSQYAKGICFVCLFICLLTNSHSIPNFYLKKLKNYLIISNLNCLMTLPSAETSLCRREAGWSKKKSMQGFLEYPVGAFAARR